MVKNPAGPGPSLAETLRELANDPEFRNLRALPGVAIDLKYATDDNFMGRNVYGDFNEPFLHREVAAMLERALARLREERPDCTFVIFDSLRPRSIQRVLWAHVEGTPQEAYVANPDKGSLHNYGCAVDLTVIDRDGRELDMGTPFDTFDPLSEPRHEDRYLREGKLSSAQVANRRLLREAMVSAGFIPLTHEWWHFNAFPADEVRRRFRIVE